MWFHKYQGRIEGVFRSLVPVWSLFTHVTRTSCNNGDIVKSWRLQARSKVLLIQRWWLTRVSILVWWGYWGKRISFNYRAANRRVSCHVLVFQARAALLQIREQCDRAEMHHCGETWSSGYATADPFMDFKCASHIWAGDENMQIIWESSYM